MDNEVCPLKKAQIVYLKVNKAPTKVFSKYANFVDVFLPKLVAKLLKYIKIKNHAIKLIDDEQSLYGPIYSLRLGELETLKTYIENNLANGFIRSSKSFVEALIFFDKKQDRN